MSFASCDPSQTPVWFGVQSGTGAWTRVTQAANSVFTFTPGATGGVAFVTHDGSGFRTQVILGTAAEITAIATGPGQCFTNPQVGTKQVSGTVSHFGGTTFASVNIGGAQAILPREHTELFIGQRPGRHARRHRRAGVAHQRLGHGHPENDHSAEHAICERRDGARSRFHRRRVVHTRQPCHQAHEPGGDQSHATLSFVTANGQSSEFFSSAGRFFPALNSDAVPFFGVPDSVLQAGDFHVSTVFAAAADGKSARLVESMNHSLPDLTLTFGPPLSTPTVSTLGTSPSLRLRAQLPSQSAYNAGVNVEYDQGSNAIEVTATDGILWRNAVDVGGGCA